MIPFIKSPFIIAEAGVNHNGSFKRALKLIKAAKETGADCVKFQNFKASKLVTRASPKPNYQNINVGKKISQYDMLKSLEISEGKYYSLVKECKKYKILFSSTPYNKDDVIFLNKLNVSFFKLASIHIFEPEFVEFVMKFNKPIVISSGMASENDVQKIVKLFKKKKFKKYYLLQCTSDYPAKEEEANINVLDQYKIKFTKNIGYSDHTKTNLSSILALAKGAKIFEKHFTLNKKLPGPDHSASYDPKEFKEYVNLLQNCAVILGNSEKKISVREKLNYKLMRRSLVAKNNIKKGDIIKFKNLEYKRPLLNNIEPSNKKLLSKKLKAKKNIYENEFLNFHNTK